MQADNVLVRTLVIFCAAGLCVSLLAGRANAVRLLWNEGPGEGVLGYRIYYGTQSRHYTFYEEIEREDYCDIGSGECEYELELSRGHWFIAVTAFNDYGAESNFSNEVDLVIGRKDSEIKIDGGETYLVKGCKYRIVWDGIAGDSISLYLINGDKRKKIVRKTGNDGEYFWRVPRRLQEGDGYRIMLDNGLETTESNPVSIHQPAVLFPRKGSILYRGYRTAIKWDADNFCGDRVGIFLYSGSRRIRTIARNAVNNGLYSWHVPLSVPTGFRYRIKIKSNDEHACRIFSKGYFTIQ